MKRNIELGPACRALVAFAVRWMEATDLQEGVRHYRGRTTVQGVDSGWVFTIGDLFAEARANFTTSASSR